MKGIWHRILKIAGIASAALTGAWLLILKIAGIALVAAGLCVVGFSVYNLVATDAMTQESLLEAEQMLGDMQAYTGSPLDSFPPDDAYYSGSPGITAEPDDIYDNGPGSPSGGNTPKGTAKPKPPVIGMLVFESLGGRKVPVLEGTSDSALSRGAAHHPRTAKPGAAGNCVIFGHRNTVFRGFDKLKKGDIIRLEVPGAEPGSEKTVYRYKIVSMSVVEPDDPKIYKMYDGKAMTLVTCYPFHYVGSAPQRYIVVAELQ